MSARQPAYVRRATSTRRAKLRSAAALRERLRAWLMERGGEAPDHWTAEPSFDGKLCVLGGDIRLPLAVGVLIVHLPSDDDLGVGLSINTRFADGAPSPSDANPYSGKWNFSCYDDEDLLYRTFTSNVERLPLKKG